MGATDRIKSLFGMLAKIIFSYWLITIVTLGAAGMGGWHAYQTEAHHVKGTTSTLVGLGNKNYRMSEVLMFVLTQFAALSGGMVFAVDHNGMKNYSFMQGLMVLGGFVFSGLLITFLVYIFGDEGSTIRLAAVCLASAFSGIVSIAAAVCAFHHGWTNSPLSSDKVSTGIGNKVLQHPVLARFLSTAYMVSVSILLVLGQIIADTIAVSRQAEPAFVIENELLHKEDQWLTIMFISSFYALFVFGSIAIASKNFYKVEESDKNTFIALASVLWVAVVVLECIVASKSASDSDWDELNLASSVMHLVFATMIAVGVNEYCARSYETKLVPTNGDYRSMSKGSMGGYF